MPVISRFFGIAIVMYWNDHNPPHLHAKYGAFEGMFSFDGEKMSGNFPPRASKLVVEWINLHKAKLLENWRRAHIGEALEMIEPLE